MERAFSNDSPSVYGMQFLAALTQYAAKRQIDTGRKLAL